MYESSISAPSVVKFSTRNLNQMEFTWLLANYVTRQELNSAERSVLVIGLKSREGKDGKIYPKFETLTDSCGMSKPTLNTHIQALEARGWLEIEHGTSTRPNHYQVTVPESVVKKLNHIPEHERPEYLNVWLNSLTTAVKNLNHSSKDSLPQRLNILTQRENIREHSRETIREPADAERRDGSHLLESSLSSPSSLATSPTARQPHSLVTEPTAQDQGAIGLSHLARDASSAGSKPAIGPSSLATDNSRPGLSVTPVPRTWSREIHPDFLTPGKNKEAWLRNEETGQFWPAHLQTPMFWEGIKTRKVYLTTLERIGLGNKGRLDFMGDMPQNDEEDF